MSFPTFSETPLEDIESAYSRLTDLFASHATKSIDYRMYNLKNLAYMIKDNEGAFHEALKRDLDKGPWAVTLEETSIVINEVDLAVRRLRRWMKDETRYGDSLMPFKFMRPRVHKQPKGVALIIGPWNYPIQCILVPLVGAIAAGCPAILKPSEMAPAYSALLASLIPKYLDTEGYAVVQGGIEQTTRLLEKPWGHIVFTGSTRVGKIVAEAAARTLTPTTLELGGKSPVIVTSNADIPKTAIRLLSMKQLGIGQVCVSPDYILCVQDKVEELCRALVHELDTRWPKAPHPQSFLHTPHSAALRGEKEFQRQVEFMAQADRHGEVIYRGEVDAPRRRMGITIVKMPPLTAGAGSKGVGFLEEEIFGPVLPIIPVTDIDEAIAYINARPNPLSMAVCTTNRAEFQRVMDQTQSGNIMLNDTVLATPCRSVPFGGSGDSGWGSYHGEDGFRTFSHHRSVLEVPLMLELLMHIRYPPSTPFKQFIVRLLFFAGISFGRPVSVEHERRARIRDRAMRWVVSGLILLATLKLGGDRLGYKLF